MKKLLVIICLFLVAGIFNTSIADVSQGLAESRFSLYQNYLKKDLYYEAGSLWETEYLYEVNKYGIYYKDVYYKFDCTSPLIANIDKVVNGTYKLTYEARPVALNFYRLDISLLKQDGQIDHEYYSLRGEDGLFYLVPKYWNVYKNMSELQGRYFKLFYFKESQFNPAALASLDQRIFEMAKRLEIDEEYLGRIESDKITYILFENENQMKELSGSIQPGWHDPTCDFILSSYLPHTNSVADFLIKFKFMENSLHVLPFMERGLRASLGSKEGSRFDVFGQLLDYSIQADIIKLDQILTLQGFNESSDLSYFAEILAGYFLRYLENEYGMSKVLEIYSRLSGDRRFIDSLSQKMIEDGFEDVFGKSFSKLEKDFYKFFENNKYAGIKPLKKYKGDSETVYQSGTNDFTINIYDEDSAFVLDISAFSDSTLLSGAIILSNKEILDQDRYRSPLYNKHFPRFAYSNQAYGILFDTNEIGVYDYYTNEIIAKYISIYDENSDNINTSHLIYRVDKHHAPIDFKKYAIYITSM